MTTRTPRPVVDATLLNSPDSGAQWTNLGFWRDARTYAEAATDLARRTGQAARLGPGDVVLDIACGHGDSLALWVKEFGVKRAIGVEPDPAIVLATQERVNAWGLRDRITLRRGEAETMEFARDFPGVTAVVCVDAAYLFASRANWLKRLGAGVAPGARLGLADLLVPYRERASRGVAEVARRAAIPTENLWSAQDVEPVLAEAGWVLDRLVRCGPDVLGGFSRFAFRSALRWAMRPQSGGWRALATGVGIAGAGRGGRLDYTIISATKR
ncbi:MAG: class I SAM-dependent methyltransferase [Gemmatimonadetes bacterium]|nr:class I SAM-dependent methyltransferase [Gemmatimonadota bacterium]